MTHARSQSWRTGLAVTLMAFIALVATMVAISLSQRVDLVADDYYERSLRHEEQIASVANTRRLGADFWLQTIGDELLISFPPAMEPSGIAGRCVLYRPSDRSLDRNVELHPDTAGVQRIALATMVRGLWKAQLSWGYGGNAYYVEMPIILE